MKRPLHILIVEDEAIIALGLQMQLELAGYGDIRIVATGEDALAAAARLPPDLVLMDNGLPGDMDGIDAAEALCAQRPVPIIFMTGYAGSDLLARARALNPLGYLVKPVQVEEIEPLIASLLEE